MNKMLLLLGPCLLAAPTLALAQARIDIKPIEPRPADSLEHLHPPFKNGEPDMDQYLLAGRVVTREASIRACLNQTGVAAQPAAVSILANALEIPDQTNADRKNAEHIMAVLKLTTNTSRMQILYLLQHGQSLGAVAGSLDSVTLSGGPECSRN